MTTWRTRVADFFALDSRWVRVPSPDAARRDATIALVLFAVSAVGLEMLRSGGGLRNDTPVWLEYLGSAAMAAPRGTRSSYVPVVSAISMPQRLLAGEAAW